jgi:hypothetical protein
VHLRLKNNAAVRDIINIDLDDPDMLSVNGCMEKIKLSAVLDKIAS